MPFKPLAVASLVLILLSGCESPQAPTSLMEVRKDKKAVLGTPYVTMSADTLYDKVLGLLVGSAIGDAMGTSIEMWPRKNIEVEFGFVDSLDRVMREPSPEGPWDYNLPAGGTTDDTRWKVLVGKYFVTHAAKFYGEKVDPRPFAKFITDQYSREIETLKLTDSFEPAPFEERMRRVAWLQEWALVAQPFADNNLEGYIRAVNKFYGGEMVCAGMLYSPMVGIAYPGYPDKAYQSAHQLAIFDLGYAKDITALTSAMVAAALSPDASPESILNVIKEVDPRSYFKSRLVGRTAYHILREAIYITDEARSLKAFDADELAITEDVTDTLYLAQLQKAYKLLDAKNQGVPFHAGEIYRIHLTALIFSDFDFRKSLEFVMNYGRDNDTVGAVAGAILGAYYGFNQLPQDLKTPVVDTNKNKLGIDLEALAKELTDQLLQNGAVSDTTSSAMQANN